MENNFPSMSDLEFLKSVDGLPDNDIKYYLSIGIINADQAKQLGYVAPTTKPSAAPKPSPVATSNNSSAPKSATTQQNAPASARPNINNNSVNK